MLRISRYNGLQPQIANTLEAVKGSFLRFPGGNNLEGLSLEDRWKWNETIGPVENRPGRLGMMLSSGLVQTNMHRDMGIRQHRWSR